MSTVSTRPDSQADLPAGAESPDIVTQASRDRVLSERVWLVAAIAILVFGSALRLHHLELVPLHHDEGVNGHFLTGLFRTLFYQYNPENYHGPSLYYFAFASAYLLGLNTFAVRITTAVFGIATMWIILASKKQLGDVGALVSASLVAVSPGAVYLSRYFIHETLFVFFTVGAVVGLLRYRRTGKLSDLIFAWSSASLLFATKETSVITIAVLLLAGIFTAFYMRLRHGPAAHSSDGPGAGDSLPSGTARCAAPKPEKRWMKVLQGNVKVADWGSAAAIAILLFLLFYSSFFANPRGIVDALKAFKIWVRTGEQQHTHAWNAYITWLWQEESALLILSGLGALMSILVAKSRLAIFVSLWALGLLGAYSLIHYKTPWLVLNFIIPMTIVVGCTAEAVFKNRRSWVRLAGAVLLCGALSVSLFQCIRLNFFHYDDEQEAYVYAHTQREFLGLLSDIQDAVDRAGTGKTTPITVTTPEYWPLPWYLRSYTNVGYWGTIKNNGASLVVGSESQQEQLEQALGDQYIRVGQYPLRPGVVLILYTRRDAVPG